MVKRWDQRPNVGRYVSLPTSWVGSRKTRTNIPYVGQWLNNGYPFNVAPPIWIDETLDNFVYGVYGAQKLIVSFTRGVTFSISSGALPTGITMSSSGGVANITGTPTSKLAYSFTVRATGASNGGYIEKSFSGTPTVNKIVATGGTITDYNGYRVHQFSASTNFVITSGTDDVYTLLLAGGGGGAGDGNGAGGGGAGGLDTGSFAPRRSAGTYPVVVGAGGAAGGNYQEGSFGGSSTIFGLQGNAGAPGGDYASGFRGGCGGGGGFGGFGGTGSQGGNGGTYGFYNGGGGGGIGSNGSNGNSSPNETGGNGGNGLSLPTTGWLSTQSIYGGGGGGGGGNGGGTSTGGTGGGGNGRGNATGGTGLPATSPNTGSGGGGGYSGGGSGSSGYVWIRYAL